MTEYIWEPHEGPQKDFCSRSEFEVLFGGAAGPGKTLCLIMVAVRYVDYPNYRALILRRTFPQLQEIIDRCWHWYPKIREGATYRATEHRWYFPSGATIQHGHLQHENDKYNYQGKEYHFIGFDEVTQFTGTQYLYLQSRARSVDPGIPVQIRATTNPGGVGHVFFKTHFVDVTKPGETYIDPVTGQSRAFVPAKVTDNPTLVENDPQYIARLEALPEIERRRLLHGDWNVFGGQAFAELSDRLHGCDDFPIPPEWEKFLAFDWGFSKPSCALWFAVDHDNTLYLYRELYLAKESEVDRGLRLTNTQIAQRILSEEREKISFRVADPACWSPSKLGSNQVLGPSFVEDANKVGLFFLKADNDRIRGRQQIHQRLMMDQDRNKDGVVINEYPRFMAFRSCKNFWRTMGQLRESEKNPEDIDTKQEDHLYDCFRYGAMSRPIVPKRQVVVPPGSFQAERAKYIRAREYSRKYGVSLSDAYMRVK